MATAKNISMEYARNVKINSSCTALFVSLTLVDVCNTMERTVLSVKSIMC